MTERATFRVGELKTESGEVPSPEQVAENIQDKFSTRSTDEDPVTGEPIEFAEKGRNVYHTSEYSDYNFCFFTYVADTTDSFRIREEGEEVEDSQIVLEIAWVIYFDNGQFAFQSRDDIADAWIPRFIKKRSGLEPTNDDYRLDKIGQSELKQQYAAADRVSKISFSQREDDEIDNTEINNALQNLIEVTNGLTFSTGQGDDRNLKDSELINMATDALEIQNLKIKKGDENMITLKQSGRVNISWNESDWNEDNLTRNRAQTVRSKLRPYMSAIWDTR